MSDDALIAAADLETVRQLRAALDVAMQENEQHNAYERTLESKFGQLSRQLGEQNTTIGYQDAMLKKLRSEIAFLREWLRGECTISDVEIDEALKVSTP